MNQKSSNPISRFGICTKFTYLSTEKSKSSNLRKCYPSNEDNKNYGAPSISNSVSMLKHHNKGNGLHYLHLKMIFAVKI